VGVVTEFVVILAIPCVIVYLLARQHRERNGNAPLVIELGERVSFRASLDRASVLGTGGFGGTRGAWIRLRGPKRLTVGTDAFMVSAPLAGREFVFTGRDSSIALSRAPSQIVTRDWIVVTRQDGDRQLRLAITRDNLPEVWQALAGTGVTLAPAMGELEQAGYAASALGRATGWRRVALGFGLVVIVAFIPPLVELIARHLR
jgi:hypothetical protein